MKQIDLKEPIDAWSQIPGKIRASVRGLSDDELELKGGPEGWSIREFVHHLVEANLVASNMIIAALATDGGNFDWTWVNPNKSWMRRVGYHTADIDPAIRTLSALCRHISTLVALTPGALIRSVKLNDKPGAARYVMTIEEILNQETKHAAEHNSHIQEIRERHSR